VDPWERFAREGPESYIATGIDRADASDRFFESGREWTDASLEKVADLLPSWEVAVEIGSGIGRLALPHAARFGRVRAVDVAPTMLDLLRGHAGRFGIDNVETYLPDEDGGRGGFDYAYSFLVFQHIADWHVIARYIEQAGASIRDGGVVQFQFDTRPPTLAYRIRNVLPDLFLPRLQRRGIRRVRRDPAAIRRCLGVSGFTIASEENEGTASYTVIGRRGSPATP
jgi:SAM-dependent methyltransferase